MLRSLDQAERTHEAMTARGYHGVLPIPKLPPLGSDIGSSAGRRGGHCSRAFVLAERWLLVSDTATGPMAIEAEAIGYTYPDGIAALADLTSAPRPGEFVAVMGANGAGKTTLMKSLMRLVRPQQRTRSPRRRRPGRPAAGRIVSADRHGLSEPGRSALRRHRGAGRGLRPAKPRAGRGRGGAARRRGPGGGRCLAAGRRPIHHLSFGEQKRVCLAGMLAMQPAILVLDEPTAGLDPVSESHMIDLLLRLNRQQNITLILSTHSVDLLPVLAIADLRAPPGTRAAGRAAAGDPGRRPGGRRGRPAIAA